MTTPQTVPTPSVPIFNLKDRPETPDSDWCDKWGGCKVCGGEIPHGHTETCIIHKYQMQERELSVALEENTRLKEFEKSYHKANGWNDTSDNLEDWIRNLVPEITQCQLSERSVIQQVVDMREGRDTALQKARASEERVRYLESCLREIGGVLDADCDPQEMARGALAKPASVPAGQLSPDPETAAAPADGSRTP